MGAVRSRAFNKATAQYDGAMSSYREPCWVLLAQTPAATFLRMIDDGPNGAQWRLVRGTRSVNALVDDEPGTEYSGERELAETLSHEARCYVGYFDPPWISSCENGQWVDESEGDPYDLARSLGCPLNEEPAPFEVPPLSALVVEGVAVEALAHALGWPWPLPPADARKVLRVPLGAAAWEDGGDLIDYALDVAEDLKLPMYTVEWGPDNGLRCQFIRDAVVVSAFDHPPTWWSEVQQRMPDVLGHTEPGAILAALGLTMPPAAST